MEDEIKQFIVNLIRKKIIKFGKFTLKSGDISPFYIDLRLIPSYPNLFQKSLDLLNQVVLENQLSSKYYAGLISAGVPFATGLVLQNNNSLLQIRSKSKSHGRKKLIEGSFTSTDKVLIVDDLISTGASKVPAIKELQRNELEVEAILVLIDRRKENEISEKLLGKDVYSVITTKELIAVVKEDPDILIDISLDAFLGAVTSWSQSK